MLGRTSEWALESNNSNLVEPGGVVTYHDITIDATLPLSMFLFEIDGNISFNISSLVRIMKVTYKI